MTGELRTALTAAGIQVDDVLERFLNNETLMLRLLKTFPDDPNFPALTAALAAGDTDAAFRAAHTLKGVCGNLSMERMYPLVCAQTEHLRAGDPAAAARLMPRAAEEYHTLCAAIRELA